MKRTKTVAIHSRGIEVKVKIAINTSEHTRGETESIIDGLADAAMLMLRDNLYIATPLSKIRVS
jgi:hypothetical protein